MINPLCEQSLKGVQMSKVDILVEVKKAETAAAKTIKKAEDKAQSLISEARAKASGMITESRAAGQSTAQAIIDAAKEAAGKEAEKVSAEGDGQIATIKEGGAERRSAAVELVMASFMAD